MKKKYKLSSDDKLLRKIFGKKLKSKPLVCPICGGKLMPSSISCGIFPCYFRYICWKCLKVFGEGGKEKRFRIEKRSPLVSIVLKKVGNDKESIIKIVRHLAGKSLKEARGLINTTASGPQIIINDAHEEIAWHLKRILEAIGAEVEIK